jgi:hypothetical protein
MHELLAALHEVEPERSPTPSQTPSPSASPPPSLSASDPLVSRGAEPAVPERFLKMRQLLAENVIRNQQRIEKQNRKGGEDRYFSAGDVVGLAVPPTLRAPLQKRFITCMVVEVVKRGPGIYYRLRCSAGVLDSCFPADVLQRRDANLFNNDLEFTADDPWLDAPMLTIGGAATFYSNATFVRCKCNKGCKPTSKCACRAAGASCNRRCGCRALSGCTNCS